MPTGKELERLIVRLVGQGNQYEKVLNESVKKTEVAAGRIDKITKQQMGKQNKSLQAAARITRGLTVPTNEYKQAIAPLGNLYRKTAESINVSTRAVKKHTRANQAAAAIARSLRTPTEKYRRELERLNKLHHKGALSAEIHAKAVKKLNKEYEKGAYALRKHGQNIQSAGRRAAGMGTMMTFSVTLPVAGAVAAFASFDDAMTQSLAIMGDMSGGMRKKMAATARELALHGRQSAKELAASYYYLASAGMDAEQSVQALGVVQQFATAGAFDMSQATDLLTDAQSALGLTSKDATENMQGMLYVSDALVRANTLANASVQQFSEALTNTAGAAIKQFNMDIEEGVAILAAYADQGIKGQEAGSMFGRMTRLLISSINDNKEAFEQLNIPVEEFATTGKNLKAVIEGITRATEGMGPAQKAATLESLGFEARIQQAILPLLGLTERIQGYEDALRSAGGTTAAVAESQLTSFSSQIVIVWHYVTELAMSIGEALAPVVLWLANILKSALEIWNNLGVVLQTTIAMVVGLVAAIGPLLIGIGMLGVAVGGLTTLMATFGITSWAALAPVLLIVAKVAAIVAITAALGVVIQQVVDYIWGPGSFTEAFSKLWATAKSVLSKIVGFIANIGYNFRVLMEWLPNNWQGVVTDLVSMIIQFVKNSISNFGTLVTILIRLFTLFYGFMVGVWKKIFSVEFLKWVWTGVKKAAKAIFDFVKSAWEGLKSIFTGGGGKNDLEKLSKKVVDDFQEGMNSENVLASAADIIREESENLKTPLEGFQSSLESLPEFKTDFGGSGVDPDEVKDDIETGAAAADPQIKMPEIEVPEVEVPDVGVPGGLDAEAVGGGGKDRTDFKQVALNRLSLEGLSGAGLKKEKQPVEAPGIERRLDELIDVTRGKQTLTMVE